MTEHRLTSTRIPPRTSFWRIVPPLLVAGCVAFSCAAIPARGIGDPSDVDGRLDIAALGWVKGGADAPLVITVATYGTWPKQVLAADRSNELAVDVDRDLDGRRDLTARIVPSPGGVAVRVFRGGERIATLHAVRPNRRTVVFLIPAGHASNPSGELGIAARSRYRGGRCEPVCRDRSPDAGWEIVKPSQTGAFTCTEVIGFSQTRQWYLDAPDFEAAVGDDGWQIRWQRGAAINYWADPDFEGWSAEVDSPCASGSASPDRVILTISSKRYEEGAGEFVPWIRDAVRVVRDRYPDVERIVLQPVVGGPDHEPCFVDGIQVRSTHNHPLVDLAIDRVAGDDVVAGASPEVRSCADYSDEDGHLREHAWGPIGLLVAAEYTHPR